MGKKKGRKQGKGQQTNSEIEEPKQEDAEETPDKKYEETKAEQMQENTSQTAEQHTRPASSSLPASRGESSCPQQSPKLERPTSAQQYKSREQSCLQPRGAFCSQQLPSENQSVSNNKQVLASFQQVPTGSQRAPPGYPSGFQKAPLGVQQASSGHQQATLSRQISPPGHQVTHGHQQIPSSTASVPQTLVQQQDGAGSINRPAVNSTDTNFPLLSPPKGRGRGRGRGRGYPVANRPGTVPTPTQTESVPKVGGLQDPTKNTASAVNVRAVPAMAGGNSDPVTARASPLPELPPQETPPVVAAVPVEASAETIRQIHPVEGTSSQGSGDTVPSSPPQPHVDPGDSKSSIPSTPRGGFQIPTRACHTAAGSKGRHTVVRTNHLSLNIQTLHTKTAVHYDVSVDPDKPKRLLRRALEEFRMKHFPDRFPAFDGRKNLYAATPLPFNHNLEFRDTIKVMDNERQKEKEFKVVLKYATRVDLTSLTTYMKSGTSLEAPQQAIQVLDIVLRCAPALWFVPVGRSYFTPPTGTVEPLGDGYEMWYGLFQSVNLGWQPFVNVDVVHKGFPQAQPIVDALEDVCVDCRSSLNFDAGLSDHHLYKLKKFIIGLKVDYALPNNPSSKRTYKVNNVTLPPSHLYFELDNGEQISVEEYYRREKKVQLKYRNLPCLHVGSLKRQVPIYLPVEFCSITGGQVTQKKLSDKQTASMIRKAATSTMDRERKIKDALVRARFSSSPQVQEFGFRVTENFQEVKARVLDPPKLEYRNKEGLLPQRGVWQPKPFLNGKRLEKWTVLTLDDRVPNDVITKFVAQFIAQGGKLGMCISDPYPIRRIDSRRMRSELEPFFRECYKFSCELVVVVVSEKGSEYAFVKQVAELTVGVLTQCVKSSTMVNRMDYATAQNILLKVNSKLNGINHTLHDISRPKIFQKPIMIVGADVTHPSPDETKIPSVAAVCASHDPKAFQYNTQFRLQPPRMEIIQDLESIMRQHLLYFYHKTGQMKPLRILFYRDGVSEGQFQQVLDSELTAIRSACSKLERDYKPAITFLVVQKRHHTRLFPTKREDSDGRNCNVVPGTIVDSTITHPTERDFYLVSHTSIQGVIRPTKYHCLWDDNRLSEDELEEVTYFLCHLFSRCTRSVSYPAPTYYAHLAAYRARVYLSGQNLEALSDERLHTQLLGDLQKKSPMYFI